jgi:hypothetical protein
MLWLRSRFSSAFAFLSARMSTLPQVCSVHLAENHADGSVLCDSGGFANRDALTSECFSYSDSVSYGSTPS